MGLTPGTDHTEGSLFGCTFDATGTELECGTGTWDRDGNQFSVQARPQ